MYILKNVASSGEFREMLQVFDTAESDPALLLLSHAQHDSELVSLVIID
jgi:hypothetical protein